MASPSIIRNNSRRRNTFNRFMSGLVYVAVALAVVPLVLIVGDVLIQGGAQMSLTFLTGRQVPVGVPGGGIGNAIEGSAIIVSLATLIALPIGVGAGIYFSEWPESRLSFVSSFMNDVLAEFPTITLGIFVYIIIVLSTRTFSATSAGVVLALIMIPIIARTTEESLKIVPMTLREASLALGIPRWKTVLRIVLSTGRSGLATGILLSIARAAGETAPLLFTAFGSFFFFNGNLNQPIAALPLLIYTYGISPYPQWQAAAWGAALVLVAFMLILNLSVKLLIGRGFAGTRAEI